MIVDMKKVTIVVQSKDAKEALVLLRKTGVLHVEREAVTPGSVDIASLEEQYAALSDALDFLPLSETRKNYSGSVEELISGIIKLANEKEVLLESIKKAARDIDAWKEWGDFDPELIDDLRTKDIRVRLCKVSEKELKDAPQGVIMEEIFKKGNIIYCAAISTYDAELPFNSLALPEKSLKEMYALKESEESRMKDIEKGLLEFSGYRDALYSHKRKLESLIEFNKVHAGMGNFKSLSYVRGYCPVDSMQKLEKSAENEKWGLVIEDPSENDIPPTLIKNPRWIEIIKPLFKTLKIIPGYQEVDISMWFLLFFSVFFGMLIGDAGYGAVFFIINLVCHLKFRKAMKDKSIFFLMYVLSSCAIFWGALSGTFFGQAYLPDRISPLLPALRDNSNVQALCFFIGALHLSIAHAWRLLRKIPSLKAFSEAGWIAVLWAAYLLARALIIGGEFPVIGKLLFMAGAVFIVLFTSPSRNIFKSVASGIGDLLLNIINSFTDVVSYIRLFAVGAATVAVADAFNQMALSVGFGNIFTGLATSLILLFGHTLNILLGAMAILVHGVRLNVLEFSSHLNMEWSGTEYAPFKQE